MFRFPPGALLNIVNDYWRLVRIGQAPVGLEVFGVCSSISHPLELANIDEYYISSFHTGYCFIPSDKLEFAKELFAKGKAKFVSSSRFSLSDTLDDEKLSLPIENGENNQHTTEKNEIVSQNGVDHVISSNGQLTNGHNNSHSFGIEEEDEDYDENEHDEEEDEEVEKSDESQAKATATSQNKLVVNSFAQVSGSD